MGCKIEQAVTIEHGIVVTLTNNNFKLDFKKAFVN